MSLPRPAGRVSVEGVYAAAPGQKELILRGMTFALQAGETLCVVGPSGAGKTTLARILVGIWPAVSGAHRLDGYELSQWNPQELGQYVGYLPQDVELFSGTVAQNISRFQDEADPKDIIAASRLAGCHEMIQHMADGYNTQIGDGGQALSGGQRQRVALARALYGNPSLVVPDEPNSNLDSAGEEALTQAIRALKERGATVVLITHKINILATANKILVMAGGMVQDFGSRDKILSQLAGPRALPSTALATSLPTDALPAIPPRAVRTYVSRSWPMSVITVSSAPRKVSDWHRPRSTRLRLDFSDLWSWRRVDRFRRDRQRGGGTGFRRGRNQYQDCATSGGGYYR